MSDFNRHINTLLNLQQSVRAEQANQTMNAIRLEQQNGFQALEGSFAAVMAQLRSEQDARERQRVLKHHLFQLRQIVEQAIAESGSYDLYLRLCRLKRTLDVFPLKELDDIADMEYHKGASVLLETHMSRIACDWGELRVTLDALDNLLVGLGTRMATFIERLEADINQKTLLPPNPTAMQELQALRADSLTVTRLLRSVPDLDIATIDGATQTLSSATDILLYYQYVLFTLKCLIFVANSDGGPTDRQLALIKWFGGLHRVTPEELASLISETTSLPSALRPTEGAVEALTLIYCCATLEGAFSPTAQAAIRRIGKLLYLSDATVSAILDGTDNASDIRVTCLDIRGAVHILDGEGGSWVHKDVLFGPSLTPEAASLARHAYHIPYWEELVAVFGPNMAVTNVNLYYHTRLGDIIDRVIPIPLHMYAGFAGLIYGRMLIRDVEDLSVDADTLRVLPLFDKMLKKCLITRDNHSHLPGGSNGIVHLLNGEAALRMCAAAGNKALKHVYYGTSIPSDVMQYVRQKFNIPDLEDVLIVCDSRFMGLRTVAAAISTTTLYASDGPSPTQYHKVSLQLFAGCVIGMFGSTCHIVLSDGRKLGIHNAMADFMAFAAKIILACRIAHPQP